MQYSTDPKWQNFKVGDRAERIGVFVTDYSGDDIITAIHIGTRRMTLLQSTKSISKSSKPFYTKANRGTCSAESLGIEHIQPRSIRVVVVADADRPTGVVPHSAV
jgi:hypothetical protein